MDRAGALKAARKTTGSPKIDDRAGFCIGRAITPGRAVAAALGEAQDIAQDRSGRLGICEQKAHAQGKKVRIVPGPPVSSP